jgi:hypothetical protein
MRRNKTLTNSRADKIEHLRDVTQASGKCTICPPNKGCNKPRKKRGEKQPRYKDKRK